MPLFSQLPKEKIQSRFGKNKTEEICRLLYEIARREELNPSELFEQTIATLAQDRKVNGGFWQSVSFHELKRALLKRRYPNFNEQDLQRVFLSPLRISENESLLKSHNENGLFVPTQIFVEKAARNFALTKRVLGRWPDVPAHEIDSVKELRRPKKEWMSDFGKRTLAVSIENFDLVKPCPCSSSTVSCNYYLLNIGYGCPFDCSYCYLQDYQNLPAIILPANIEFFLDEMAKRLSERPNEFVRIGTGEFADSLALDFVTEYSKLLIPFFADKNVILELKTKSDCVENLIGLPHGGKTVIAWSPSPERYRKEEKGTAPIAMRLAAARRSEQAGYGTAFHFDPIIDLPGAETEYENLVKDIFSHVGPSVRWFSMGTLRFHRDLRQAVELRHPNTEIFLGEGRLDPVDGKMRYPAERRISLYRTILQAIRKFNPKIPVYLCMESAAVWKSVFEGKPYEGRIDEWIACGEKETKTKS